MSSRREGVAVAALFTALAVAATYPLITGLSTHIASDRGDPVLVAWMLAWDADRMRHGLAGIWDAPNFFPYRHTLLYSEHFLGVALFTAPIQWATRNPVLVYNIAFLAAFIVSGCGMYVLARGLTGRRSAALVAALIFAFHPFRASHSSHLQLLMVGWLPLSVWALHRYFRTERLRHLAACVVFYLLQTLTAGYFAYYALLPLAFVAAWELWTRRSLPRRFATHAAVVAVLALAVMLPVVRAYVELRRESGQRRALEEIISQSADVADYLSSSPSLIVWNGIGGGRGEHELFPGLSAVALAALAIGYRRRSTAVGLYAAILGAAFVLSLGPSPRAFGRGLGFPGPYAALLRIVPGLDGLRVPARLAIVCQMALAVLAAFGFIWLADRFASSSRARIAILVVFGALIAAEGWARIESPPFDPLGEPRDRDAYAYLESLPRGAAMELPTAAERLLDEFTYQYMTLVHHHPVVNGHSGYVSPLALWLRGGHSPLREEGRQHDAVEMLRSLGVRYLVIHRDAYEDAALRDELLHQLADPSQAIASRTFERITVAVLAPLDLPVRAPAAAAVPAASIAARASDGSDRLPALFDGDRDSRWLTARPQAGDEWLALTFDRARDVASVRMQLGARSFGDYPRDLSIDAVEESGSGPRQLFRGSVLPQFARGILADGDYPFIDIPLPPNRARTLQLRQRGTTHTFFWSIHELQILERR